MVLFSVRHASAARDHSKQQKQRDGALMTEESFSYPVFPECSEIASLSYPGGCDPTKNAYACYSLEKVYRPWDADSDVEVPWICSRGFDKTNISNESCARHPWSFEGEVNGTHLNFTVLVGMYAGACQFSVLPGSTRESTKGTTTPEQSTAVGPTSELLTEAATTTDKASVVATTSEQLTKAATTSGAATTAEQPTEVTTAPQKSTEAEGAHQQKKLPECWKIASSTYPGGCNPILSHLACYSLEKVYRPKQINIEVDVHWACSNGLDNKDITNEACAGRPWNFDGQISGGHVNFTAPAGIYAGACQFYTMPGFQEESTKAATTPETMPGFDEEPTTKPEKTSAVATTPEQAATTQEESTNAGTTSTQPKLGQTTPKNGGAAASLFSSVISLLLYYVH